MTVEAIHLGERKSSGLRAADSTRSDAGKGLENDRHFHTTGAKPGQALTLVEAENAEPVGLSPGEVECYGVELCEPCTHLQAMTRPGVIKELTHRAGINADILTDGTISGGDEVVELS